MDIYEIVIENIGYLFEMIDLALLTKIYIHRL